MGELAWRYLHLGMRIREPRAPSSIVCRKLRAPGRLRLRHLRSASVAKPPKKLSTRTPFGMVRASPQQKWVPAYSCCFSSWSPAAIKQVFADAHGALRLILTASPTRHGGRLTTPSSRPADSTMARPQPGGDARGGAGGLLGGGGALGAAFGPPRRPAVGRRVRPRRSGPGAGGRARPLGSGAAANERRSPAGHGGAVDRFAGEGAHQAPVEPLWSSTARSWRCLVSATGWLAAVQGRPTACKPPAHPVALAGVFSRFENARGEVVRTFGLVTAWREDNERFGHHGPLVIEPRDVAVWLGKDAGRARAVLAQRQPPVVERGLRRAMRA